MISVNLLEGVPSPNLEFADLLARLAALEQTVALLKAQSLEDRRALIRAGAKIAALTDTVSVDRAAASGTTFEEQWDAIERTKCVYLARKLRELRQSEAPEIVDALDDRTEQEGALGEEDVQ
jgi:hypothetical protein